MSATQRDLLLIGAVLLVGLYVAHKASAAAQAAANAVNPLNHDNIFAGAVNGAGAAVSGDPNWSLGGWLYDVTHPTYDPNALPDTPAQPGGASGGW